MIVNNYNGIFVTFDGPNGVGKSTIINEVSQILNARGYSTRITKEPSNSMLGNFVRKESEYITGNALACLIAANRYEHLESEIIPQLMKTDIVISDRYILSSFILQRIDNVDMKFIKNINNDIIIPDIQIALIADEKTIKSRLAKRSKLHRFEKDTTSLELRYTKEGIDYLKKMNFNIQIFNTEEELDKNTNKIVDFIEKELKIKRHLLKID